MGFSRAARLLMMGLVAVSLAGCGGGRGLFGGGGLFRGGPPTPEVDDEGNRLRAYTTGQERLDARTTATTLFQGNTDPNVTIKVNKYIWNASLDVLNFLPIQSVDPFTGVIVTGFGTPPGGGRAYRATIYVQDPALDARSLRVALQTSGGAPVSRETARAVEDAILTRARQLRVQDRRL